MNRKIVCSFGIAVQREPSQHDPSHFPLNESKLTLHLILLGNNNERKLRIPYHNPLSTNPPRTPTPNNLDLSPMVIRTNKLTSMRRRRNMAMCSGLHIQDLLHISDPQLMQALENGVFAFFLG